MRPRAFCELPAGLAALSLRLHGGPHCRPPISRMGNKAGYAEVILAALGLRSGQGAGAYVWAEADPDVRALLRAYPDPEMLRRIAEIIRGWKDEEPRALWERLRAERKARGPESVAQYVHMAGSNRLVPGAFTQDGRWVNAARDGGPHTKGGTSFGGADFSTPPETSADACHRLAEYASIVAEPAAAWAWLQSRSVGGIPASEGLPFYGPTMPAGDPKDALRGRRVATCDGVAQGFERVAGWALLGQWAYRRGLPESGFNAGLLEDREPTETGGNGAKARTCEQEAGLWGPAARASRWPPVAVLATLPTAAELSAMLGTPGNLEGVVVYMDPPYVGTTGYLADLPRADVVRLAREYDALGAVVCVSEAVPVEELVAVGWHAADIGAGRKGQRRTFARVATEALTMNREPAHRVAVQASLFGAP